MKKDSEDNALPRLRDVLAACFALALFAAAACANDGLNWQMTPVCNKDGGESGAQPVNDTSARSESCQNESSLLLLSVLESKRIAESPIEHLDGTGFAHYRTVVDKDCRRLALICDDPLLVATSRSKYSRQAQWGQSLVLRPGLPKCETPETDFSVRMILQADLPPGATAEISLVANGNIAALGKLMLEEKAQQSTQGDKNKARSVSSLFILEKKAPIRLYRLKRNQLEADFSFNITVERNGSSEPAAITIHELAAEIIPKTYPVPNE